MAIVGSFGTKINKNNNIQLNKLKLHNICHPFLPLIFRLHTYGGARCATTCKHISFRRHVVAYRMHVNHIFAPNALNVYFVYFGCWHAIVWIRPQGAYVPVPVCVCLGRVLCSRQNKLVEFWCSCCCCYIVIVIVR